MKKSIMLGICLFVVANLFAQDGINFNEGTWKEVLSVAKKENKLVFVDVYTSWCGPCKKMVAEVFPKKEVGDLFNASFVNYKMDAEKGEGIQVAKSFDVKAYPTYLFVNGDGELVYRVSGFTESNIFLQQAAIALKEQKDPKPLIKWMAEYDAGKRHKKFLIDYLKKRAILKLPSADILEEVFPMLSNTDLNTKETLNTLFYYDSNIEYVPGENIFKYVTSNYKIIDALLEKTTPFSLQVLNTGIGNYFRKNIIANKREDMLKDMLDATEKLSELLAERDIDLKLKKLQMDFYAGTGNEEKLISAAQNYVENGLMKMNIAALVAEDAAEYQKFMEPYLNGKADSTKTENWSMSSRLKRNNKMISISFSLRGAAEAVFIGVDNNELLLKAIEWARQANDFFPHFSSKAVYAALLYKMGDKQKALQIMQEASNDSLLENQADLRNLLLENVAKIEKGEPIVNLWRR